MVNQHLDSIVDRVLGSYRTGIVIIQRGDTILTTTFEFPAETGNPVRRTKSMRSGMKSVRRFLRLSKERKAGNDELV